MPQRVRPHLLVLLPALTAACAEWPRFAADNEPVGSFDQLHPTEVLENGDWPNDPSAVPADPLVELVVPMDSVRFDGFLDPYGTWTLDANTLPFPACPDIVSGIEGSYQGDVDMFVVRHPGNALCLHLEAPESNASNPWDVVAYAWNGSCAYGPFLTPAWNEGADIPATTAPGLTSRIEDIGIRDLVVYVASGTQDLGDGIPPGSPIRYTLDVVSTLDAGTCSALRSDDFGEPR